MVNGKPIYYRGWQAFLRGEKTKEQIRTSSLLQGVLVGELFVTLHNQLRKKYILSTNETWLKFAKGDWRAADIALFSKESIHSLYNKYANEIPEIVVEVDTKADASDLPTYYLDKTKHLHARGVRKVIWIYTDMEQVMVAEIGKRWEIFDWSETVQVTDDCTFNVKDILADFTVPKFDFSGNIFFNLDKNVTSSLDKLIDIKSEKHKVSKSVEPIL